MVDAIEEESVAFLKQELQPSFIIVLEQFVPEWREVVDASLSLVCVFSFICLPFVIASGPVRVDLQPQVLVGQFWALKDVAEVGRARTTSQLILILQPLASIMILLQVEFQMVLRFKLLVA